MQSPERRTYDSPLNGEIVCERLDGRWHVWVDGYDQSSPYISRMWADAFRRVPRRDLVRRVLLLGLGAGAAIKPLHWWFPLASIDAVEWDPTMVSLAHELDLYPSAWEPRVLLGDAAELVPDLAGPYDLIVCDLFRGHDTASALERGGLPAEIARLLAPRGTLLLNVFENAALLGAFDAALAQIDAWPYAYNLLAAYVRADDV